MYQQQDWHTLPIWYIQSTWIIGLNTSRCHSPQRTLSSVEKGVYINITKAKRMLWLVNSAFTICPWVYAADVCANVYRVKIFDRHCFQSNGRCHKINFGYTSREKNCKCVIINWRGWNMKLWNINLYNNINQNNFIRKPGSTEWFLLSRQDLVKDNPYLPTVIKNSSFRRRVVPPLVSKKTELAICCQLSCLELPLFLPRLTDWFF